MRATSLAVFVFLVVAGCRSNEPQPPSVAELKTMLVSPDLAVQLKAVAWVRELGPAAVDTKAALLAALKSPHPSLRQNAALAIGRISPPPADVVAPLIETLGDADYNVRSAAADTLAQFGPAAKDAIPALEKMSQMPDPCKAAESSLKRIRQQR